MSLNERDPMATINHNHGVNTKSDKNIAGVHLSEKFKGSPQQTYQGKLEH